MIDMNIYMTEQEAAKAGFTNHGKYYGLPVWIGGLEDGHLVVCTKLSLLEPVMTLFHMVEQFLRGIFLPEEEPAFQFFVGEKINSD